MPTNLKYPQGEPRLNDPVQRARWYTARQLAMEHILTFIGQSHWQPNLVLRGSTLLKSWFGERAREPGDLDWVAIPQTLPSSDLIDGLFGMLRKQIWRTPRVGEVEVSAPVAQADTLWPYSAVPGCRQVFPWRTDDGLTGVVQLDIAFREPLLAKPFPFTYHTSQGTPLRLLAATPAQSLAWKLLWLHTDTPAQGKDLYDAVLLAETFPLDAELLVATLNTKPERERFCWESILEWEIDWLSFLSEHPNLGSDVKAWGAQDIWRDRLAQALIPTFTAARVTCL